MDTVTVVGIKAAVLARVDALAWEHGKLMGWSTPLWTRRCNALAQAGERDGGAWDTYARDASHVLGRV